MSAASNTSREAALLAALEQAFDGVQRGDGVTLHEADARDRYASASDLQAARARDRERRWQDVPDADIAAFPDVFPFFDVRGHVYYTPAFMSWAVRHGHGHPSRSTESAQYAADPAGKHEGGRHWLPHDLYTPEQCRAIAQFLRYVHEVLDEHSCCSYAKEVLDAYWSRHLG